MSLRVVRDNPPVRAERSWMSEPIRSLLEEEPDPATIRGRFGGPRRSDSSPKIRARGTIG